MATRQKHSNNGTSTLLGAFNIGATSCSVQAGHGARFPSPAAGEYFLFALKDAAGNIEICKVTQRTADTFNVVARAQEGTTERNWLAGDLVEARLTRDTVAGLAQKDADETITAAWNFTKTLRTAHGADVASANNLTLGDGNSFNITGSTTINTIATKGIGTIVLLQFAAALQLTHHATDLILPSGANIVTAAGDTAIFEEYQAGKWRCWSYQRANGGAVRSPLCAILEDQKASTTPGGDFNSGAARQRTLNTEVYDPDGIVSLVGNRFTLGAGTYLIEWFAPAYRVDIHQSSLYNVTTASTAKAGTSEKNSAASAVQTRSIGMYGVTLAGATEYEIQHQCSATEASDGFGTPAGLGGEVYTQVKITKIA